MPMIPHDAPSQRTDVMVVDDDAAARLFMRAALEQGGFGVLEAANGVEAVEMFRQHRPSAVLMDVMMPEMDGFTACAELRKLPEGLYTPILMVTGCDDVESIKRAFTVQATDFVTKPINWLILSHRVRYMLRAREVLEQLRRSRAHLAKAQRVARLGHWEWERKTDLLYCSDEMYDILGVRPESLAALQQIYLERTHPDDADLVARSVIDAMQQRRSYSVEHRLLMPDGVERTIRHQAEVAHDINGEVSEIMGTLQDVSEHKRIEEQIRRLAYYDALTNLPNRISFKERMHDLLVRAARSGQLAAVMFIDLDRFKTINDTLGHTVGDSLLQEVAQRIRACVRGGDAIARSGDGAVARLGGDEFVIALHDISQPEDAARVARRMLASLTEPCHIGGHEIFASASIGVSVYPHDGTDLETLLKNADVAMYQAKYQGGNTFQFYTASMNASAHKRLNMENALRRALEREEFVLHYQPQVDMNGAVVGIEALLRWRHPELGLVSPVEFIPIAEETGLIIPIGAWVLREACRQGRRWHSAGFTGLRMTVNLSSRQFRQRDLLPMVREILQGTVFPAEFLELEITEGAIMQNTTDTLANLRGLHEMGVRLAIDDFGTGYSSLSYLKRFPIDTLKIDRSFVSDLPGDANNAGITGAIIAIAHHLKLTVVAEGVENEAQLAFLHMHACDGVQGFLFSKPLPPDEIPQFIGNSLSRTCRLTF